jgi:RNA polymerase sigma-70 factor (ECF subfamily)
VAGTEQPFDDEVAAGVRRGDPDALSEVYRVLSGPLTAYLRSQVRDVQLAEDLATETFLKLVRGCRRLEGGPFQIRSWLYRVAQRNVIDHLRARSRRPDEELTDLPPEELTAEGDPSVTVEGWDTLERIRQALEQLSPDQAEVLRLRLIAGLSAPEAAIVIGKTEGAVRALQHRGVATLARHIRRGTVPLALQRTTDSMESDVMVSSL